MPRRKQAPQPPSAPQANALEPLLTVADVQRILQLSKPKVYELMNTHGLPSLKIDGARRFERFEVQSWILRQRDVS